MSSYGAWISNPCMGCKTACQLVHLSEHCLQNMSLKWYVPSLFHNLMLFGSYFCDLEPASNISLINTNLYYLCKKVIFQNSIFTWWVQGMMSLKGSFALYHTQGSNYGNSNTFWTLAEPSKVSLGTSAIISTIKIREVTIFFSAFGWTSPLQPLVQDPHSAPPLA